MNAKKILIVILILLAITGIWIYKNNIKNVNVPENGLIADVNIDESFNLDELKKKGVPIILDFSATWCGPCREFNPILKEIANEMNDKVIIKIIDIDNYPELANQYNVVYVPTQVLISSDGKPYMASHSNEFEYHTNESGIHDLTTHVGGLSKTDLISLLKEMGMGE